jgi:replication factor C subunit 2/4
MKNEVEDILMAGFPVVTVLEQLNADILAHAKLSDTQKAKMCLRIAEADKKLVDGASEHFQLVDVTSYVMRTFHSP